MNKTLVIAGVVLLVLIAAGLMYSKNLGNSTTGVNSYTAPGTVNTVTNTTNTVTNTTTTVTAGKAPTAVTASTVSPTDTTAIVNGNVNPNGAITSYWYEYGTGSNLGNKTVTQTVGSGFVPFQSPGYITGLVSNTTYYFRLTAENQYGRTSGAMYSFVTTSGNPPPSGSAPTVKTSSASNIQRNSATVNGEVTPNKASTQYWFEYGKTTGLGNNTAITGAGSASSKSSVSASLSGLDPSTTYYFRIDTQNQFGTVNGSILNFQTSGPVTASPAQPTVNTQSATSVTASGATLNGTINPNGADTKYWFEYSTDSQLGSALLKKTEEFSVGGGTTPAAANSIVSLLKSNTTYYVRLVAQNVKGTVRGNKLTFKTQ